MLLQLKKADRVRLREQYECRMHPLFLVCDAVFTPRAAHLNGVDIGTEEVFCAIVFLLEKLLSADDILQQDIDSLWTQSYTDIRKIKLDASEHDKFQITHTIFAIVRKLLCHHWDSYYSVTLFDMLTQTIEKESYNADKGEIEKFKKQLFEFSDELNSWINSYNSGDDFLSKETEEVLKGKRMFASAVTYLQKADAIIKLIHEYMEGKTKPKDVMMPIRAAMDAGVIRRPTDEEFNNEFGENKVKGKSSFNDYTNPDKTPYTGADFDAMKAGFRKIAEE